MSKILILDLALYPERLIEKAIGNYQGIAEITYSKNTDFAKMFFEKCLYDEKQTVQEFENHLIELCNIRSQR